MKVHFSRHPYPLPLQPSEKRCSSHAAPANRFLKIDAFFTVAANPFLPLPPIHFFIAISLAFWYHFYARTCDFHRNKPGRNGGGQAGVFYHIELQLASSDNHIRRVRFYSAMVDSELLEKGTKYSDLPDTYIFYISMNDFMGLKQPIAQVESTIGEANKAYDDGKHIYYVNAGVDDRSAVANLMNYFKLADPNDSSHGELSDRIHLLKCEKEGEDPMCAITQSIFDEGKIAGAVEILRNVYHLEDEKIMDIIKDQYQLNDYQARTFVYPKENASA